MQRALFVLISLCLAPVYLAAGFLLLAEALARLLVGRKRSETWDPPDTSRASIVVLNWNGRRLLEECLPSVFAAIERHGGEHEVIVVDNGSNDGSVEYVRDNFPEARLLALEENMGFALGNNCGVRAARNDIVVLLNNDMVVAEDFLGPLLEGFGEDVFAVSAQIFFQDPTKRREETGKTAVRFRLGRFEFTHEELSEADYRRRYVPILWAGGGSSAFDRRKFLALGGFSEIYSPAYVEDVDISYRAWRRGWSVLLAVESRVFHKHRASSARRFSAAELERLIARNQILFLWRNLSDVWLLFRHIFFLPLTCYRLMRERGLGGILSFFSALRRLPAALALKLAEGRPGRRASDSLILSLCRERYRYYQLMQRPEIEAEPRRLRILMVTAYLPHFGMHGGAGRMFNLIKRIGSRHQVSLLTFLESEDERRFVPEIARYCDRFEAVLRAPRPRRNIFPYAPLDEFDTPEMHRALAEMLELSDYDLVHYEYLQMGLYAYEGIRSIKLLTEQEVAFAAQRRALDLELNRRRRLKKFYDYLQVWRAEIEICRRMDKIICVTPEDAAELLGYVEAERLAVLATGVDLTYFSPDGQPGGNCEEDSLVFVGAFRHYPNVDAMLYFCAQILPLIRKELPRVKLYIVGSQPPADIVGLACDSGIVVTGTVPDIRPYLARAAVYIAPLRLGVGIRGKILEAWAMGKPVVATSPACAGIEARDGENIMIADEPQGFAAKVLLLLKDRALRQQLALGALETVRRYDWDRIAAELENLYYSLLRGRENRGRK